MIIENRFLSVGPLTEELRGRYLFMALPTSSGIASDDKTSAKNATIAPAGSMKADPTQKAMLSMLESLETTIRDQHLK